MDDWTTPGTIQDIDLHEKTYTDLAMTATRQRDWETVEYFFSRLGQYLENPHQLSPLGI